MAVAFRGANTPSLVNSGSTVSQPPATVAGDALILVLATQQTTAMTAASSGWTVLRTASPGGTTNQCVIVLYRIAASSGSTGHTLSLNVSAASAVMLAYSGTAASSFIATSAANTYSASASSFTFPAVAGYPAGETVLVAVGDGALSWTPPAGTTERVDYPGIHGANPSVEICDAADATTAVYGPWTATASGTSPAATIVSMSLVSPNQAPNAPVLGSPANGSYQDLAAGATFQWTFSDPDAVDSQSAYAFRRKISGAGSYEWWNAGTSAWVTTETFNTSSTSSVTFAASKWTNGNVYNWSVATQDAVGATGTYATDATVTASTAPTVTAVTAPAGVFTTSARPTVTWTYSDAESSPQTTYRVRIFTAAQYGATDFTPDASTSAYDSDTVASSTSSHTVTSDLVNGTSYRAYVTAGQVGGQTSAWAFSSFSLVLDVPAQPYLTASYDPTLARTTLNVQGADNALTANQASLETDTTGWTAGANTTIARSTAQFLNGAASLSLTATAAGAVSASTPTGASGVRIS